MKTNMKKGMIVLLAAVILFRFISPEWYTTYAKDNKPTHGTADTLISEDMLSNEVPKDYKVNPETQGKGKDGEYNALFLKDDIQTISIEIDENNLNYLFQNADEKPTVMADKVTIGDTSVSYVGLKTKGSYTLDHSYTDNQKSDRFSLTINFGSYVKKKDFGEKQNIYGVEKISLNNFFFDKSMMKEYCSLLLMKEMGIPTPQFGLAKVYINGEYFGVYSMIEALDSPILEQYFQCSSKKVSDYLCKPEGTTFLYDEIEKDPSPLWEKDEDTYEKVKDKLPVVEEWIRKLNLLSGGKDFDGNTIDVNSNEYLSYLDQVIDTDEFVRCFAAHSFLCQLDNMFVGKKNFGLYVGDDGRALMIPWDYDLSFGCYSPTTAESTANYDIELMYMPDRGATQNLYQKSKFYKKYPLFNVIFQNDALREQYHTYMLDCSKIMALGGTTSFGKTVEPGLCNKYIETLTEALIEAASEPTAKRAGYMNGIVQPRDVKGALPNLSKIVMMRSVGVYEQVMKIQAHVSGRECNLFMVGNGQPNMWLVENGNLTGTDPASCIFTTAKYQGAAPFLTVENILSEDERYNKISEASEQIGKAVYEAYSIEDAAAEKVKSAYTVSIPCDPETDRTKLTFFSYEGSSLIELSGTWDDNIFTTKIDNPETIVLLMNKENVPGEETDNKGEAGDKASNNNEVTQGDISENNEGEFLNDSQTEEKSSLYPVVIVGCIGIVMIFAAIVFIRVSKKKRR